LCWAQSGLRQPNATIGHNLVNGTTSLIDGAFGRHLHAQMIARISPSLKME